MPATDTSSPLVTQDLRVFCEALPSHGRLLAYDYGTRRVGIAVSDLTRTLATPEKALVRSPHRPLHDEATHRALHQRYAPCGLILGWPVGLHGADTSLTGQVARFGDWVQRQWLLPLLQYDERLTTKIARQWMQDDPALSGKRKAMLEDSMAATVLLREVLEQLRTLTA